ncbi:hypothetical protein TNCV_516501 [Trichonephila clavipes]|nr:hypothetical protein TNCV_516501 [Trichonephila clavipes]
MGPPMRKREGGRNGLPLMFSKLEKPGEEKEGEREKDYELKSKEGGQNRPLRLKRYLNRQNFFEKRPF